MVAVAPIPPNEAARLDALKSHQILDTPPDERFDFFTRLCTWLYDVPLAAINLVDAERTFYKSLIGMPRYEPRRLTSICAHAIAGHETLMVVEDLTQDRRFDDHPLLVEKGMRFYAGAILHSSCGHRLGTLCIGTARPRTFDRRERERFLEAASGVGAVLDLHRTSLLLQQAANQDYLTGLCNRRMFTQRLEAAVARAQPDEPCIILCLDLDGFKLINDTFGHAAGDALLIEAGRRLTAVFRGTDIVARLGGDEFAVLLQGPATLETACALAARVVSAFAQPYVYGDKALTVGTSIGIAMSSQSAADAGKLMHNADAALYQAKRSGRGQCCVYQNRDAVSAAWTRDI